MKNFNPDTNFSNEHGSKRTYLPAPNDLELPFYPSTFGRTCREVKVSWPENDKCFIVYSEKGMGRAFVGGRWQTVPEGSVIYYPPRTEVKYMPQNGKEWTTVFVTYAGKAAESMLGVNECIIKGAELSFIPEAVDEMTSAFDRGDFEGLNLLLYSLLLKFRAATGKTSKKESRLPIAEQIKVSIKYISEYYCDDLSLSGLSSLCGISEEYYCRIFKEITGTTPTAYINALRITRACDMLQKNPDQKVEEIAAACGFRRHSYFNKVFKEAVGATPTEYRSQK